nr:PREDICTED: uncharacterized protein LOC109633608 [Paralichthys olivaceus]
MGTRMLRFYLLVLLVFTKASSIKIQNKLIGKCLQVQEGTWGGRVSLGECSPYSPVQEWSWLPESQALSSHFTGECLTAPAEQYEGVHLQPCISRLDSDGADEGVAAVDIGREESSQAWSCSKKGHLSLMGRGLHLSATPQSTLVYLSQNHKQGSRWRSLDNQTLCNGRERKHIQQQDQTHIYVGKSLEPGMFPTADENREAEPSEGIMDDKVTETHLIINGTHSPLSTKSPADPTMIFFSMDYGMAWKITMLVLSSLALVLGTVILILNVYTNRRKKVVCVLKSYTVRPEVSVPGSPVPSDRAPLTEHAMRLPHSSPTLHRGEILIEWKDGTVTPLYEA